MLKHRHEPAVKPLFELAFAQRSAEELYDLSQDPDQLHNVAGDSGYAAAKARLAEALMSELKTTRDPRVLGTGGAFDGYPYYWGPHAPGRGPSKPAGKWARQDAYVKKVVDTVNDLDNVLYEISKESGVYATAWQYHMIDLIHQYEAGKPKQHPVGMTFQHAGGSNAELFAGPADWISPSGGDGYQSDPPAADGRKVLVNDTDHSFFWTGLQKAGPAGQQAWVWT
jgi:hypothetical protein